MVQTWAKCYRALRGITPGPGESWQPNLRLPEIWPIVRSSVGWKLDQRITPKVSPQAPLGSDWYDWLAQRSRDLETVLDTSSFEAAEELELEAMLWDADTYGTGFLKTGWEANLWDGLGDAVARRIDPHCIYPDPAARSLTDCDRLTEAKLMSIEEIDRRFPGKGHLFEDGYGVESFDEPPSQLDGTERSAPRVAAAAVSPGTGSGNWSPTGKYELRPTRRPVLVLETWVKEHKIVGGSSRDGWRCIVTADTHVLLNERAEDLWRHGHHPYDRYVPHELGEFWGIGLVELLGPAQAALNRIIRAVQQNVELCGNPILVEDIGTLTQGAGFAANRPGMRLPKRPQNEIKWLEPPKISADVTALVGFLLERMKMISGLGDLTQGNVKGRPAADLASAAQEAQFVSIRSQLINLEHTLSSAYTKKASLIAENYTEPRWLSTTGPDGQETPLALQARHFMRPGPDGSVPLEFSIRVEAGSASHTSRQVREDKAITLATLGKLDTLTLLEMLDIPNPQNVMRRLGLESESILAMNAPGKRERARAA